MAFISKQVGTHHSQVELVDLESAKGKKKVKGQSLAARRGKQNGTEDAVKKQQRRQ